MTLATRTRPSLLRRFAAIAQPYFFPRIPGGGWVALLLMGLLLVFLFGVLFLLVAGLVVLGSRLDPGLAATIAPGLLSVITHIFHSKGLFVVLAALLGPAAVFVLLGRHLRERRRAWLLLAIVLFLSLSVTGLNVSLSYIGNYFTNALVGKKESLAYTFIATYFCAFLVGIPIVAFYSYVQQYLGMRWREWMTGDFLDKYFAHRSYYEIETRREIDNPDQRIMEDIRSFTRTSLTFLLIVLGSLMDLVSFTGILWSKSALLVWVVLGYSFIGTGMTVWIGRRLVGLNFNQLRYEADFRYALVHVRDNTESIAFYQGEKPEQASIASRFRSVLRNYSLLIGWQRNLSFFTTAYSYLPVVLPFLALFPLYFSGQIEYGDMVQANFAFSQVYAALSLIVAQIEQITNFAAGVERLSSFEDVLTPETRTAPGIASESADRFALEHLTLQTPNGVRTLIQDLTVDLNPADTLLVVGQSGIGKSSLLRAVAGLWTQGGGTVRRPPLADMFFLPQKPYMLLGTLRDQLLYPRLTRDTEEARLREALKAVRLQDLPERVGGFDVTLDWADVLSLGEQQRLAFARLLLNRPGFAVLDEATSALGLADEATLYDTLRDLKIRYISVGHRRSLLDYHTRVLDLQAPDKWRVLPVQEYKLATASGGGPMEASFN